MVVLTCSDDELMLGAVEDGCTDVTEMRIISYYTPLYSIHLTR